MNKKVMVKDCAGCPFYDPDYYYDMICVIENNVGECQYHLWYGGDYEQHPIVLDEYPNPKWCPLSEIKIIKE